MAREKEHYRDNLERLNEKYTKELLTLTEAKKILGLRAENTKKVLPFKKIGGRYYVSKSSVASYLS